MQPNDNEKKPLFEQLRASLFLLAFGLCTLAFLVAIDRPEWFELRPASGTAAAMSNAGNTPTGAPEAS
ncbi:hypothetical protein [Sphingomonas xinjiangensis]|uniref:Uncharacterized protein n=1 Tax=Sphingomonas xinjiangensis TaxID=643568 RepID=A0A840YR68_9SPHN|nr:hypothetical protein [Sphingomonas xinjiangensis]MBB5711981.1 hypothetical protein [Sphingomonas xinjiangensis]